MQTPRDSKCFPLVAGCCSTGKCTGTDGSCGGCKDKCTCPDDSLCKRGDVRVKPDLGGGSGMLIAGAAIVLAAGAAAAAYVYKNKY